MARLVGMRVLLVSLGAALFTLGCGGADLGPLDDAGTTDAAKLGVSFDAGLADDSQPAVDAATEAACVFEPTTFTGYASCEPVADSRCDVASACGDGKYTAHYSCVGGPPPGPAATTDFQCIGIGNNDYCCVLHKCVSDPAGAPNCPAGKFGTACPLYATPDVDASSGCNSFSTDTDAGASIFCCDSFRN